jgi:hypothetical protein
LKETTILKKIMLACSRGNARLFRNNVGAFEDKKTGRWIRFGVGGNGGADLLGWRTITLDTLEGKRKVAIFCALEVKRPGQRATKDQARFLRMVERAGGIAKVVSSPEEAKKALKN